MGGYRSGVALIVATIVLLSGCSSSLTRQEADAAFLRSHPDATEHQAGCVVDKLIAIYGLDGLRIELEREVPARSFEIDQFRGSFGCGLTDDVEAELARQLEATGIEAIAARCAAKELTTNLDEEGLDVLLSGEITDDFYEKYFVALEACNALP